MRRGASDLVMWMSRL